MKRSIIKDVVVTATAYIEMAGEGRAGREEAREGREKTNGKGVEKLAKQGNGSMYRSS